MALSPMRVSVVGQPTMKRKMRFPQHPFVLKALPWVIQPTHIAPVLPGETMKNGLFQARVVTDPVKHPLVGWWCEHYTFYVKLRDLYERDALVQMVLDPAWDPSATATAFGGTTANPRHYFAGGANQLNYVKACLDRVVDEYFRDENEVAAAHEITDASIAMPIAGIQTPNVMDSVKDFGEVDAQDVVVEGPDADTDIEASEVELAMRKWEMLRLGNLSKMTFEEFLEQHGIRQTTTELHRPELIRYVRDFSYPSNTIDPSNGTPRSAVSWTMAERADKARFFKEPGFIFGVMVVRPKVYLRNQTGSFTSSMNDLYTWLPNMLQDNARASWKLLADGVGPLAISNDTGGYWFDVKDLLMYGEQFTNVLTSATDMNMLPLPNADLTNKRYPTALADIQELFVTGASAYYYRADGIASYQIATTISDTSPRGGPADEA